MSAILDAENFSSKSEWSRVECDHRIANSLSMISALVRLQAAATAKGKAMLPQEEAHGMLIEAAGRVETVARLHRSLATLPEATSKPGNTCAKSAF